MTYKYTDDRDCEHCAHEIIGLCEKLECEFEPKEDAE